MSNSKETLDDFLTQNSEKKEDKVTGKLEDEFAKLLNDFINQSTEEVPPQKNSASNQTTTVVESGLESFVTPSENKINNSQMESGLESFITSSENKNAPQLENSLDGFIAQSGGGLDSFITPQVSGTSADGMNSSTSTIQAEAESTNISSELSSLQTLTIEKNQVAEEEKSKLKNEEKELARAVTNFKDGVIALAEKKNLKVPETDYNEDMLYPNYKPSVGKKIAQYLISCWDVINKYDPENMKRLSKDAGDEEYLTFAESLNDTDMQLAIISYVEILINLEICEVNYEQKREIIQKNRIKKELYEEYMELQERRTRFIKKLKEKNFPINAEKLIGNYFKAAQKDAEGAYKALTKNPAMFSPIEFDKIQPKFFGLIKVTPEDGIKANQKIGEFIKKLKV